MTSDPRGEAPPPVDLEPIKKKLASCMDEPDWPTHNCRCSCDEVSKLLAEIGRLESQRLILPLDTYRNDDGSIVIDGQRYTPDAEIVVHQG